MAGSLLVALLLLAGAGPRAAAQTATAPTTGTSIGSSPVGTASAQAAVTFSITASGTLGTTQVLTTGLAALDFTLGTGSTCTGARATGSCVVNVAFTPRAPGLRLGAVELTNTSGAVIATALIYGTGTGPLATQTPGTILTLVGNGTAGYTGSTAATAAELNAAQGIAVDAAGNVYLADTASNRVLKLSGSTVTSVAGGGTGGNGGAATAASLSGPVSVALDGAGNLYILEQTAGDVRVVTASTGLISTFPGGTGETSPMSLALDTSGAIYVAVTGQNAVVKVSPAGTQTTLAGLVVAGFLGDGETATLSLLNAPAGIGLDAAGNIYIADTGNQRLREITVSNGDINTIAGSSTAGFSGDGGAATSALLNAPKGQIVLDAAGDIFFPDSGNNRIREISALTHDINTVAGSAGTVLGDGGAATAAQLKTPLGLALDAADNLYISDSANARLREVTATEFPITFASTQVNSTSADSPRVATVNNAGNAALSFAVPASGVNPATAGPYVLGTGGTCPQISPSGTAGTLAVGATCTTQISFKPTVVSTTNTGSLVFTDNSNNVTGNTWSVALGGASTGTTTSTALTLSPASGVLSGSTVTLTATLTPTASTGSVTFFDNGVAISPATAVSGGTASYADTAIAIGTHSFTAVFTGTGVYAASTSAAAALTATLATATTVALNPSARVIAGQAVALTATLSPTASTGSVVFSDNGTAISGAIAVSNGSASYSDSNIAMGNHSFTAAFTGTGGYNNSTSAAATLFVTGPATQLVVAGAPLASNNGVLESYTVTAEDSSGNVVTGFTGSVTSTSTDPLATLSNSSAYTFTASDNGVHTFSVTFGTAGTQSITATSGSLSGTESGIQVNGTIVSINSNGTASQLAENGTALSGSAGYSGGGAPTSGLAVDASGDFFALTPGTNVLAEFSRTGAARSGSGFTGGGLSTPAMLAVDGAGQVWITNGNGSLSLFSNAGVALSPTTGFAGSVYSSPTGIAIDLSGNVWVANSGNNTVTEVLGAAAPVAPLSTAVLNGSTGARP